MAEPNKNTRRKASSPIDQTYGHLQPQALDIEKVVLGALMIDKDAFPSSRRHWCPRHSMSLAIKRYSRPFEI